MLNTSRRGFLQLSASSAAALTVGASLAGLTGCSKVPAAEGYKLLRAGDIEFLSALAPVILNKSYPGTLAADAPVRLTQALDTLIGTLEDYSRSQLIQLLDVMQVAPIRAAMGAQWGGWSEASAGQIEAFLQDWKTSSIQLKRMGYGSLCKLLTMCWYSQPETFVSSGYPGAPKKIPA